jgi:hypothetical protein
MSTKDILLNQGIGKFYVTKASLAEGGYNYYGYIHPTGYCIIMREKTDSTEIFYADGGYDFNTSWAGRTGLTYKRIDLL